MTTPPPPPSGVPMTPERWRAVEAVLHGALARIPEERAAFVREACERDDALRREVESLLAAHDRDAGDDFLERPAIAALVPEAANPADALARASMNALARELAGRYAIEREIARGGMATVYLARDLRHDRPVAIKVLRDAVAATVGAERFLAEIRVTASLHHPHVLPLFDSGSAGGGLLWYVMPYVEGETLRSRLAREGALPVTEAVRIAREVADALDHAHAHGVVHRDVKPENVLLQGGHALVADFGIALALERAGDRLTRTGLTLGTPRYMAPEQASGEREIDARVDVYALGAVLREMLAGAPPDAARPRAVDVRRMGQQEPPPPALVTQRADVPPALDAAVRRAMATRPDERFPSAASFATALGAAVAAPKETVVPTPASAAPTRRGSAVRAAAYSAAVVGFIAGVASGWGLARSTLVARLMGSAPTVSATSPVAAGDVPPAPAGEATLAVLDRAGRPQLTIPARRPWTPRFSPDGRRVAYGAFGDGRSTSDVWVTELATGATRRVTDDDADANDPQWSADGATIAYSVSAAEGKDVAVRRLDAAAVAGASRVLAARPGIQFPSDWSRDGRALLVTEDAGARGYDILVQPVDGSPARPYAATPASETGARVSPDGRWVAYTSDASGHPEVYVDAYPLPGQRVRISTDGGLHPAWRGDGRELYYWRGDALVALPIGAPQRRTPPAPAGAERVLFRAPYQVAPNTMYDVSPDGQRFVVVRRR
ncbi:MAG TPA: protein kinase [Gemmatimonadaceae bacterium]|nr:protein kinase [Gemmatimonadaceae bacterium]